MRQPGVNPASQPVTACSLRPTAGPPDRAISVPAKCNWVDPLPVRLLQVTYGARDPTAQKVKDLLAKQPTTSADTVVNAVNAADVILLATLGTVHVLFLNGLWRVRGYVPGCYRVSGQVVAGCCSTVCERVRYCVLENLRMCQLVR